MVRSEGNMSLKTPVTPPRIDPGTVRLVAQRLNHSANPGPTFAKAVLKSFRMVLTMQITFQHAYPSDIQELCSAMFSS
jgi:hypothetical protein